MGSQKQAAANRENALQSTGPRTAEGKNRSSQNAIRHGILSNVEVLPGVESPEAWAAHREGVVFDLRAEGVLEIALAERAALALWRLGRVARYERESAALGIEAAVWEARPAGYGSLNPFADALKYSETLVEAAQESLDFTNSLKGEGLADNDPIPAIEASRLLGGAADLLNVQIYLDEPGGAEMELEGYPDGANPMRLNWEAGNLRSSLEQIAKKREMSLGELVSQLALRDAAQLDEARTYYEKTTHRLDKLRRERIIPAAPVLDKVAKYENHLERSLSRSLKELQRVQGLRLGAAPPFMVDVNVEADRD